MRQAVAELQAADRLRPVSVVVASLFIGAVVQRSLAESGCANVRPVTLRQVAAGQPAHSVARRARRDFSGRSALARDLRPSARPRRAVSELPGSSRILVAGS